MGRSCWMGVSNGTNTFDPLSWTYLPVWITSGGDFIRRLCGMRSSGRNGMAYGSRSRIRKGISIWTELFSYAHHEIHERHERETGSKPLPIGFLCVLGSDVVCPRFAAKLSFDFVHLLMRAFYRLNVRTRRKHGVPPQPYRLFQNLWELWLSTGWGFLALAHRAGDLIAGSVFLTYKDTMVHKFNASDPEHLEHQPNHALLWYAIQWGCEHGTTRLDLGRTSPDNRGLMDFKRRWGAAQRPLSYFYFPSKRGAASTEESSLRYRMLRFVFQRSPLAALEAIGGALYRHLG